MGSSTESSPTHSTGAQKAGETCSATDMDIDGQARREAEQDASASGLEAAMEHEAVRGRLEGGDLRFSPLISLQWSASCKQSSSHCMLAVQGCSGHCPKFSVFLCANRRECRYMERLTTLL